MRINRIKKWQTLAIHNSSENRVLKKLLNATDNSLSLVKTASITSRNDFMYGKMININAGLKDGILKRKELRKALKYKNIKNGKMKEKKQPKPFIKQ